MTLEIAVNVTSQAWRILPDLESMAETAVLRASETAGAALAEECEVSLTFCDDAMIRELNAQWRGKDQPTNVLSFPTPGRAAERPLLGDVIIAYETTAREAREQNKTLTAHVSHLIIHGFLHLIGYDHIAPRDAEVMENMERRIMTALGVSDPYDGAQPIEDETDKPKDHADTKS